MIKKYDKEVPIIETKYANIYPSDIERIEINYINKLPNENDIYNVNTFIGLLFMLNREVIKPALLNPLEIKPGAKGYNIIDLDNIFFNIFIPLIAKYKITPTISLFYYLTGLDSSVISRWNKDIDNNDSNDIYNNIDNIDSNNSDRLVSKNNINKYNFYLKWNKYIEGWILQNTVSNNSIGSMFALKAVYGYSDSQPIRVEVSQATPTISEKQLQSITASAGELPRLPEQ